MTEHASSFPFADRRGLADDFFEPSKIAHLAVEAPIADVSPSLVKAHEHLVLPDAADRRLEAGVAGNPRGDRWPIFYVFQFRGQNWTQAFTDIRTLKSELDLARHLSKVLDTRCLCLGVTDDAYYSHALVGAGTFEELVVQAMDVDIVNILRRLDMEVPDDLSHVDPDDYMSSEGAAELALRRDGGTPKTGNTVGELVADVGCYLHTTFSTDEGVHGIRGVAPEDLVRLDAIW